MRLAGSGTAPCQSVRDGECTFRVLDPRRGAGFERPFDGEAARMYGRMFAPARAAGPSSRPRLADLLIASTAAANSLPLYTRNPTDCLLCSGGQVVDGARERR